MRKLTMTLLLALAVLQVHAIPVPIEGYRYGNELSPSGKEWESPEDLALNKELPHAWFFSFDNIDNARKILPENSIYWKSLDGTWKFHWVPNPEERPADFYKIEFDASSWDDIPVPSSWNIQGIEKDGSQKYGTPIYVNQPLIFMHTVKPDDWKGGVMRTPPSHWTTYKHRNEVGSYRREFTIPKEWTGREIFLNFDGVDSFFYLWVNGQYVGFSKNSRNLASFNITDYLVAGKNILAVEVYRSSDGSFLESQDMFRLPGIFRSVSLTSKPSVHIRDLVAIPDLDANYKNGELKITADIRNLSTKPAKDWTMTYSLYANEMYSDKNSPVKEAPITIYTGRVEPGSEVSPTTVLKISNPNIWSAEKPYRYTLVAQLKDKRGRNIETVSTIVGFRKVEILDTPAANDEFGLEGRYFYVNGKTVKLKGVNRHETNPSTGHVISREQMEDHIMIMKRANINHVRNAHYPDEPYWYYLCDKYGIYLQDEANIESHAYYYGEASLSHPVEWRKAHIARVLEMAHATVNHPSIVIWSMGNEAGPGDNFKHAYNALKAFDKSRPIEYERNSSIADFGANQYPSIAWVRDAVQGKRTDIKYPFHIQEYAHSMGNAVGNLVDYWKAIESTNYFLGGAIWDFIDQAMYNYTPDGTRYLAYGGDFGDTPNDGQFVMNGILFADLEPKPQYYEVKKVYQHIDVAPVDIKDGLYEVFNKYYFKNLSDYQMVWSLYKNGDKVDSGLVDLCDVAPRTKETVRVPYSFDKLDHTAEYFVKLQFVLSEKRPWADKGYVMAEEQIQVNKPVFIHTIAETTSELSPLTPEKTGEERFVAFKGNGFDMVFDNTAGTIYSLKYGNKQIIEEGNGPVLDPFRAFVNNDNWVYESWFANGLHNLRHKVVSCEMKANEDGSYQLCYIVESQAPNAAKILGGTSSGKNSIQELTDKPFGENDFKLTANQVWTIYKDGSVGFKSEINSNKPELILPRIGYVVRVPSEFANMTYYGRGPIENYPDRKTGQFIEKFETTVAEQFVPFPKPQEMGNHEDVRWCALTNAEGQGAMFIANEEMSVAANQYSALDMTLAGHPHQLPESDVTYLHLDAAVTGLGGNSCGQGAPLKEDRVYAGQWNFGFVIRPAEGGDLSSKTVFKR